jgi:hypothetical protein
MAGRRGDATAAAMRPALHPAPRPALHRPRARPGGPAEGTGPS